MRALRLASCSCQVANQIQFNTIRRPTKQIARPIRRYNLAVTQTKPVHGEVNRCASVKRAIKKSGLVKDKDLFNDEQVEKSTSEAVVIVHEELAESQASESSMPGMQQEIDHEESAENKITNITMLDTQ